MRGRKEVGLSVSRPLVTKLGGEEFDLDDFNASGIYFFFDQAPEHSPSGINGWLIVLESGAGTGAIVKQIWMRLGTPGTNDYNTWVRTRDSGGYGPWHKIA